MIQKYHPVSKDMYEQWMAEHTDVFKEVSKDPRRLAFHLMPATGWLNDPNGLCQFHGTYHIYYQYDPFDADGDLKLWAHYTTKDFIHYKEEEAFLFPDSDLDTHGAYSGSAFVANDQIYYFYTGNIKLMDDPNYDYIHSGRVSNTIGLVSKDGFHFDQKKLLMGMEDYPEGFTQHIRDPKIIEEDGVYTMVLGARDDADHGCILLYRSTDLENWTYAYSVQMEKPLGYMWECPDLFEVNGQKILISCPQGVEQEGYDYANVHSCTWMKVDGTIKDGLTISSVHMFDRGCDFYAPQSFTDEKGRQILIGWMGIPDADYTNPTTDQHWQHALTLARELTYENGVLYQRPLEEYKELRIEPIHTSTSKLNELAYDTSVYEMRMHFENETDLDLDLSEEIHITLKDGVFTLDITDCGCGRGLRQASIESLQDLWIYSDTTSLEIFVNQGCEAFTTRIYPNKERKIQCSCTEDAQVHLYQLRALEIE